MDFLKNVKLYARNNSLFVFPHKRKRDLEVNSENKKLKLEEFESLLDFSVEESIEIKESNEKETV